MFSYRCSSVPIFHDTQREAHSTFFPPSLPPACVRVPTGLHKGDDSHVSSGVYTMRNKGFSLRRRDAFSSPRRVFAEIKIDSFFFFPPLAASRSIKVLSRSHSHKPRR